MQLSICLTRERKREKETKRVCCETFFPAHPRSRFIMRPRLFDPRTSTPRRPASFLAHPRSRFNLLTNQISTPVFRDLDSLPLPTRFLSSTFIEIPISITPRISTTPRTTGTPPQTKKKKNKTKNKKSTYILIHLLQIFKSIILRL